MVRESPDGMRWVDGPRPSGSEMNDKVVLVDGVDRGVVVGPAPWGQYRVIIRGQDYFIPRDHMQVIRDEHEIPQWTDLTFSQILREGREWTWHAGRPAIVEDGWTWLLKNDQCPCGRDKSCDEECDECELVYFGDMSFPFRQRFTSKRKVFNKKLARIRARGQAYRMECQQLVELANEAYENDLPDRCSDIAGCGLTPDGERLRFYLDLPDGQKSFWDFPFKNRIEQQDVQAMERNVRGSAIGPLFVGQRNGK